MSEHSTNVAAGAATSYDQAPYPSSAFPQTQPNRLAAMARLFGVAAASPATARVLELGCADGSNLLPMADRSPQASFLGIDASTVQIAAGQAAIAAAGLENVELRTQDILNFPADAGKFDYIIAHDVFSLVAEPVREKILQICEAHLSENGVAYISYNALPGWNMRRSLRDMVLFHTAGITDAKARVGQARALLHFLAQSVPTENNAYGLLLKNESENMGRQPDNSLLHDILEEQNAPLYFHQFLARAGRAGLQYLGEPSLPHMLAANFPETVRDTLARVGTNIVAQEQYMDFLRNRVSRQTLLCRAAVTVKRQVSAGSMKSFAFHSLIRPPQGPVDLAFGQSASFVASNGLSINVTDTFLKAALAALASHAGRAVPYQTLLAESRAASRKVMGAVPANRDEIDEATLQTNLLNLYSKGFVELHAEPVDSSARVPDRPAVSALTRHQAIQGRSLVNRLHYTVPVDVLGRHIVSLCDGTRNREQILAALAQLAVDGKIKVTENNQPVTEPEALQRILGPQLDTVIGALARTGFFAPQPGQAGT